MFVKDGLLHVPLNEIEGQFNLKILLTDLADVVAIAMLSRFNEENNTSYVYRGIYALINHEMLIEVINEELGGDEDVFWTEDGM